MESGAHTTCVSGPGVCVTRKASPPSCADAAKTSPWATSATLRRIGRHREIVERVQGEVLRSRAWPADPTSVIGNGVGLAALGIELPDLEIALEHHGLPVVADGGPDHAAVGEFRDLPHLAVERERPDILRAAAVRHEIEALAVGHPHGPGVAAVEVDDLLVRGGRPFFAQPDLRFVQVAVAVPPPLRIAVAARRERDGGAIGRRRGLEFIGEAVGAHRHRRAALRR